MSRISLHPQQQSIPSRLGPYELLRPIHHGRFTTVYQARPVGSSADRRATYALKLLRKEYEEDPAALNRLRREAHVGRTLAHPHVVAVLAASTAAAPCYLVFPWLAGKTVQALLAAGPLSLSELLWIGRQTAEGLAALHAAGWMHCDVKPQNIMVSAEGHATLLDLGFACREHEPVAGERCVLGTIEYLAPELLAAGQSPDPRSDLFSLGATLYQMATGRLPVSGRDESEIARALLQASPVEVRALAPYVPPELARLIHRLLARHPLRRPESAAEVVSELAALEISTLSEAAEWLEY